MKHAALFGSRAASHPCGEKETRVARHLPQQASVMEQETGTGVGHLAVAVLGKPATIDMLSWYLRHYGIDTYGFREVSTTRLLKISVAAVVIFLDDFPRGIVDDAVSRIRRVQPHIAMVVVCDSLAPFPPVPNSLVIGKDRWRSSILDVLRSCTGRARLK